MEAKPLASQQVMAALAIMRIRLSSQDVLHAFTIATQTKRDIDQVLTERGLLSPAQAAELVSETQVALRKHAQDVSQIFSAIGLPQELSAALLQRAHSVADATVAHTSLPAATRLPSEQTIAIQATMPLEQQTLPTDATLPNLATAADLQGSSDPAHKDSEANPLLTSTEARFTKISFLARGNLGEVFIAEDRELNRKVALKEISPRNADQRDSRRRFLVEGEVTGRLEHPGIVPVYGMGFGDDGRPYYAMRLIEGRSLQEVLKDFHAEREERTRLSGSRAVEFRQLLNRLIQVCEAIEFAHTRGILHRDIKPSNIMVGPFGETLVVDWGLAKPYAASDPAASIVVDNIHDGISGSGVSKDSVRSSSSGSHPAVDESERVIPGLTPAAHTLAGSMVGTPAYMSPEQASGEAALVGPLADIYSLGATLYHLLTGQPPIEGKDLASVLLKIRSGKITPPRKLWRAIPRSLESICMKAMATDPTERYQSARLLAEDLQRQMADEPIKCHRGSVVERTMRWARHHQTLTASFGAASLVLVATLTAAFGIVSATNQSLVISEAAERSAKEQARNAQLLAEKNERDATQASIDAQQARQLAEMKAQEAERNRLRAEANAEAERIAREEAVRQQNNAERTTDFLVGIFQTADSLGLNGVPFFIPRNTGETLTVNELLARGRERIATDLEEAPETRAAILTSIGNAFRHMGEFEEAQQTLEEALAIRRSILPEGHPDIARSAHDLAFALHELGLYDQAEKLYREALEIRTKLEGPESQEAASIEFNLAWLVGQAGDPEQASTMMRHVYEVRQQQDDERLLAFAQLGLAISQLEEGKLTESAANLLAAQNRLQTVDGESELGSAVFEFMWGYLNPFNREKHFRTALEKVEQALGESHIYTGFAHYLLADYLVDQERWDEAMEHLEACWTIADEQAKFRHPRIVFAIATMGDVLTKLERRGEAHLRWQAFLEGQESAFGPQSPRCAEAWYQYALFCYSRTERATRNGALEVAINGFSSVPVEQLPKGLLESYENCAFLWARKLSDEGNREEAEKWFAISESIRPLVYSATDHDGLWVRAERALNLSRWGQHDQAIALLAERHDAIMNLKGEDDEVRDAKEHYLRIEVIAFAGAKNWPETLARCQATSEFVEPTSAGWIGFASLAASAGNVCRDEGNTEPLPAFRELVIKALKEARELGFKDWTSLNKDETIKPWLSDQEVIAAIPELTMPPGSADSIRAIAESPDEEN